VAGELFRLLGPSLDRTSDSPSPAPRAGRLSEPMVRFGASLRGRSRLVPVRFRVVVPHFPSPESLSPSFGSPSLRKFPPSARRSSSSAPKVLGFRPPATSCQFLQCSRPTGKPRGSSIPSLPLGSSGITRPKARDSREHLLEAYPRARLPFSSPKTADLPSASGWSPIRFSRAPFVRPGLPREQGSFSPPAGSLALLLALPRRGTPSSWQAPSTIADSGDFHGSPFRSLSGTPGDRLGGKTPLFPAGAGASLTYRRSSVGSTSFRSLRPIH